MPRRQLEGKVVTDAMDKTVSVKVERRVRHAIYGKFLTKSKKYLAHDGENKCKKGDTVVIEERRPMSKRKTWEVKEIKSHANA